MSTGCVTDDRTAMRADVAASWERSAAAGVPVDRAEVPIALDTADVRGRREAHPLSRVFPLLDDVLGQAVRDCGAVMALADVEGNLLWVCGSAGTLRQAERIGFVEGSNWDERLAGTNAPGLTLATGREATVTRSEHFLSAVRGWSCAATPIHDPGTTQLLGVLDVTGDDKIVVPQTMAMLRLVRNVADNGVAVLLIMHNLDQVFEVSDRLVVLRLGEICLDARREETSKEEIVAHIMGVAARSDAQEEAGDGVE